VHAIAKAHCEANTLDAIIFVTRERGVDFIGGSNQRVDGAGIYSRGRINKLYLLARMDLFDCGIAKPLILRHLFVSSGTRSERKRPTLDLPENLARKPVSQWTAEDEERLRKELIALPDRGWPESLKDFFPAPK